MEQTVYEKLADVLDSLPNGFPRSESGVELDLLKKIFRPDEAELFCSLKLKKETAAQVAARTGHNPEELDKKLTSMWARGLVECDPSGKEKKYNLVPWILGIYELQLHNMDEEFARLHARYIKSVGPYFLLHKPQMMQVVPIEQQISTAGTAMPYERVSSIISKCRSFAVNECICKKQTAMLNRGCDKPGEVCLALSEHPDYFNDHPHAERIIDKEEALAILKMAEEAGLVHMTANIQEGHYFLCNCCGCCCVQLIAARFGMKDTVNSHYYATIDPSLCKNCGTCADTRCQVKAIEPVDNYMSIQEEKCIGCGLCVSTCPENAISLIRREEAKQSPPPLDEMEWYREKARAQGIDISDYE